MRELPVSMNSRSSPDELIQLGREVLRIEAEAVPRLVGRVRHTFVDAVRLKLEDLGWCVVSGMRKSDYVARKITATSLNTEPPGSLGHTAHANHGDLGMITRDDVLVAPSNSGESTELAVIVPLPKRIGIALISFTRAPASTLAELAGLHLDAAVTNGARRLGYVPPSGTTSALALGHVLAVALQKVCGFCAQDFARSHPGSKLMHHLPVHLSDVMHFGKHLPAVKSVEAGYNPV